MSGEAIQKWIDSVPLEGWMALVVVCLVVIVVGFYFISRDGSSSGLAGPGARVICLTCGSEGAVKIERPGSSVVQILLALTFVVPGVFYALWRESATRRVCGVCGGNVIVPEHSPVGRKLKSENRKQKAEIGNPFA